MRRRAAAACAALSLAACGAERRGETAILLRLEVDGMIAQGLDGATLDVRRGTEFTSMPLDLESVAAGTTLSLRPGDGVPHDAQIEITFGATVETMREGTTFSVVGSGLATFVPDEDVDACFLLQQACLTQSCVEAGTTCVPSGGTTGTRCDPIAQLPAVCDRCDDGDATTLDFRTCGNECLSWSPDAGGGLTCTFEPLPCGDPCASPCGVDGAPIACESESLSSDCPCDE